MSISRLINRVLGYKKELPVEYRIFQSAIIVGIIAALFGTIISIAISSPINTIIVSLSLFVLLSIVFYFVRVKRIYKPFIGPMVVLSFIGISIVWIVDGGMNGSNMLVGFVVLVLGLIVVPVKNKKYVISLFVVLVIIMYLIQLYRPDLITDFDSERTRWIDGIITAVYSSIFIFFIIRFFHNSYIDERKKAEDNELKFRALSENSQDNITRYNRQHRLTYVNKAGLEFSGLSKEQNIGKTHGELGIFTEEQCDRFDAIIEEVFVTKRPQNEQYSMKRQQGIVYYDWRLFPEFNSENVVGSVLGVSRDITDLKLSEIELRQLNLDKDRFISILGHDLKSPLTMILGLSELLSKNVHTYEAAELKPILAEINQSTQITYDLLEDLLTWAKAQSGKISFNPQKLAFKDICENIVEILGPNASTKSIKVNIRSAEVLTLVGDVAMLRTILRNLLSNAIKFTKKGGEIQIKAEENPENISISVSDNGVGIAARNLTKLFNISEYHSTKGTAEEKGTGLGLLLCKEFVEKHGGNIWVESEEGKGSIFTFTIPKISEREAR